MVNRREPADADRGMGFGATRFVRRLLALVFLTAACTPVAPLPASPAPAGTAPCAPTIARGRPPNPVIESIRAGASPQPSYDEFVAGLSQANWAGNDAFWVSLTADGVIRPTFPPARDAGWKFWSYATAPADPNAPFYGSYQVTGTARRLDGPTAAGFVAQFNGGSAAGPGFLATGLIFPTTGCWEVTYHAGAGASGTKSFTFVVDVQ
jgi:hypothetical protein